MEKLVIAGLSGKFPESENILEFAQNLFNGVDMVTADDRRWKAADFEMTNRSGKLKTLDKFDANFFGVHGKQANNMDPRTRMLLELTHECLIDAGVNPVTLRGSRTGVYVGAYGDEANEIWSRADNPSGYIQTGCFTSMFANRISYAFDFQGPSFAIDTACSSSLFALQQAVSSIRSGECDGAIVAAAHVCLDPKNTLKFSNLGMISPEGKCKSFDANGCGYVRSEAIVVMYVCKPTAAKRVHAEILHAKTNTDGYKEQGVTFPSGLMQEKLLREIYAEAGVDPSDVSYVEAHGTGTKVGDPQEVNAITRVFCESRDSSCPLLIGSVKSNVGHTETASGLTGVVKTILASKAGAIPGNLHFETPNPEIPALLDGRLQVVAEMTPWNGGLVGVNSFGFGGANAHVILNFPPNKPWSPPVEDLPLVIPYSGRTPEAITNFFDNLVPDTNLRESTALLHEVYRQKIPNHPFRGCAILSDNRKYTVEMKEQLCQSSPPVWFIFSGMGTQWNRMGQDLMRFKVFRDSILKSEKLLESVGFHWGLSQGEDCSKDGVQSGVSITCIQMALFDLLASLNIKPDGVIGHSVGELGCSYADGCFTHEETTLVSLARSRAFLHSNLPPGAMAAIGMTWEEAEKRLPEDVYLACHNSEDNVSISGPPESVHKFAEELKAEGVFVRNIDSSGVAFHSKYLSPMLNTLRTTMGEIIGTGGKLRSPKWVSTWVTDDVKDTDRARYSSVDYHASNVMNPVRFYSALQKIPANAVVIELAPHSLLQAVLKRALPKTCTIVGLTNRTAPDGLNFLLSSLGKIFNSGCSPEFANLYKPVEVPVAGAPFFSPLVQWDHSDSWEVPKYSGNSDNGGFRTEISLKSEEFYAGHRIDGRVLFPATGYMFLVWKAFARRLNTTFKDCPVVFENVAFKRATILQEDSTSVVTFHVTIFQDGGFEVIESGATTCTGSIRSPRNQEATAEMISNDNIHKDFPFKDLCLNQEDIYKELGLRGYEYGGIFQGIQNMDLDGNFALLNWHQNWISFLDTMLQVLVAGKSKRALYLPVKLEKAVLDPKFFDQFLNNNQDLVQAVTSPYLGTINCPGIELRGMKASTINRKPDPNTPKLEKYVFSPFVDEENVWSTDQALTFLVQIAIENHWGKTIKLVEFVRSSEDAFLPILDPPGQEKYFDTEVTVFYEQLENEVNEGLDYQPMSHFKPSNEEPIQVILVQDESHLPLAMTAASESTFLILKNFKLSPNEFTFIGTKKTPDVSLHMYRKMAPLPLGQSSVVDIRLGTYDWVNDIKSAIETALEHPTQSHRIYLVNEEANSISGILGLATSLFYEKGGEFLRCVYVKEGAKPDFENPDESLLEQLSKDLTINIFENGTWGMYSNLRLAAEEIAPPRSIPNAYVNTLTSGDLSSLKWIQSPQPSSDLNQCQVHYAPLNFRDVMLATGKLAKEALPHNLGFQDCILGMEFAGEMSNDGKQVFGILPTKCMATSVEADPNLTWEVPHYWSLAEASTVPVVYATAIYALLVRGRMQSGETVLIHSGSGGVGQAAISVALSKNCRVITTVSSEEKKQFLKKRFPQLNDEDFANSRDPRQFEKHVMEQTKGQGVNLVLNSLAQESLKASIRCLAEYGRFLEIGKVDMFKGTQLGMEMYLRSVTFHGILLDAIIQGDTEEMREVSQIMREGIRSGMVRPLPFVTFGNDQLEEAFRYMANGKHIGKVVLKVGSDSSSVIEAIPRTYFHPHKSYVIIGGLGGMALELVDWMIERGAKKFWLNSRSGVKTGYQAYRLKVWRDQGVRVIVDSTDAATEEGARFILNSSQENLGTIGGIFNLGLVLKVNLLEKQTPETFAMVGKPKVEATLNLDNISRDLGLDLDHFVVFSSFLSSRGISGQANYGYANSFMERICEQRQRDGLKGLAVQWGAVGEVGVAKNEIGDRNIIIAGCLPQRISSCIRNLDLFLQQSRPIVVCKVLPKRCISLKGNQASLLGSIGKILGIEDVSKVPGSSSLNSLGMDSLMSVEIRELLENRFSYRVPTESFGELTFSTLGEIESNPQKFSSSS